MARIAEIWRAGCIIRSALLDEFAEAFRGEMPQGQMMLAPAMAAALAWHDSMGRARGTADMIQGLRDFFGNHGFERVDRPGGHYGSWGP